MAALVKELPIPSSSPATGRIAMGSMKLRPTLCNTPKILSFIVFPPSCSQELFSPRLHRLLRTSIPLRSISVAGSRFPDGRRAAHLDSASLHLGRGLPPYTFLETPAGKRAFRSHFQEGARLGAFAQK